MSFQHFLYATDRFHNIVYLSLKNFLVKKQHNLVSFYNENFKDLTILRNKKNVVTSPSYTMLKFFYLDSNLIVHNIYLILHTSTTMTLFILLMRFESRVTLWKFDYSFINKYVILSGFLNLTFVLEKQSLKLQINKLKYFFFFYR